MKEHKSSLARRIFAHTAFIINLVFAIWLILCFAASLVPPYKLGWLALFSLTTPFVLLANIFFLFFWCFARNKWRLALPIFVLALSYKLILVSFGWHLAAKNDMAPGEGRAKVMIWNVHGLGIFDKPVTNDTDKHILQFIKDQHADILCMPEFYTMRNDALKPYSTKILNDNGYTDFRFQFDNTLGTTIFLGIAVFSKFPVLYWQSVKLAPTVYMLICDFDLGKGKVVRGFFVHLQSFMLPDRDKALIEDVKNNTHDIDEVRHKGILSRFLLAYSRRARQADTLTQLIKQSPYPVFVCGDFNDVAGSYSYTKVRGAMCDAFEDKGAWFGRTYNMFSPTLRIDNIFYEQSALKILGYSSPRLHLSDHNPVIANFEIRYEK